MKKLLVPALICAIAAGILVTGCQRRPATGTTAAARDNLRVAFAANPASLDPSMTNDQPSARVMKQIYDTLIDMDANMAPVPLLAERWVFENDANGEPTRLRLFLKRGVYFHNGDELKASDVKFTLDRASVSPHIGHITGMIQSTTVVNDYEVLITLPYPFVPILNHLAHTATSVVNERAVRELGDAHGQNPVGTGAMRFVNWVAGDRIELTRWDRYHGTAPRIKDITIRIIVDPATRLLTLETGGVDIVIDIAPHDVSRVQADPNLQIFRAPNLSTNYIGFNCQRAPFNDIRVRQAINYAIDKVAIVNTVYMGTGGPAVGPINTRVWASAANRLQPFAYDPPRARQLLAEAGYPNGFSTVIVTNDNPQRVDTAEIVQNMLRQVGINVEVRIMEWGAYLDLTARGEQEMYILGWVSVTGDPDYGLHAVFHSDNFGAAGNRSFYRNAEVDRLLDAGRRETNLPRREQLYFDAQQIIRDEAPWIFKWTGEDLHAAVNNLRGFVIHPAGHHPLWTIYFE